MKASVHPLGTGERFVGAGLAVAALIICASSDKERCGL
jgi:hypothetical protein